MADKQIICKCNDKECEQCSFEEQLKAKEQECEELKEQLELNTANAVVIDMAQRLFKLKQTLAEIKEIALSVTGHFPDGEIFARPEIEQILQKISGCEVE